MPQPCWKTSTRIPYAAPTDSRFSTTALTAITSERNDTSISTNASSRTNPNTSGAAVFIWSMKSRAYAVSPVTATSVSGSDPTVAGTMSSRSASSASFEVASVPSPATGIETIATVRVGVDAHVDRLLEHVGCQGLVFSSAIASCTAGASTSAALITTSAGFSVPGNAAFNRL